MDITIIIILDQRQQNKRAIISRFDFSILLFNIKYNILF